MEWAVYLYISKFSLKSSDFHQSRSDLKSTVSFTQLRIPITLNSITSITLSIPLERTKSAFLGKSLLMILACDCKPRLFTSHHILRHHSHSVIIRGKHWFGLVWKEVLLLAQFSIHMGFRDVWINRFLHFDEKSLVSQCT